MKKVKTNLSAALGKVRARKCAAAFSAAAVAITSVTCIMQLSLDTTASAYQRVEELSSREILELSESYLSENDEKAISVLELSGGFVNSDNEAEKLIEELISGSESESETKEEVATEKETETKALEATTEEKTTAEVTTAAETTTVAETTTAQSVAVNAQEKVGYTFEELGLTQISDIAVPDDILFDENGVPLNYTKKLTGKATAYCMGTTTATGTRVHPGVVAVNPRIIPYGSKMYIVASDGTVYGYSSAEDTGGFIYWNNAPIVDLYVTCTSEAYQWGNKQVTIYIF